MNKTTLLLFIKRILECGSQDRASLALAQLKQILFEQNADSDMLELVEQTLLSLPEAKSAAEEPTLTEEDLRIAFRRAEERKRRAAEAAQYGRCW